MPKTRALVPTGISIPLLVIAACGEESVTDPPPDPPDPPPPARLAFTTEPANGTAGESFTPAVKVAIQDTAGDVVEDATDAVTLSLAANPAGGTLSGELTVDAVSGVATFSDLSIERAGTGYRLAASSGSLAEASSDTFEITPAAPAELAFAAEPTTGEGQVPFEPVEVEIYDAFGNLVTDATTAVSVALAVSPSGEQLSGTTTVEPADGVATFADLRLALPGDGFVLEASSAELPPDTSAAFSVRTTFVQVTGGSTHACVVTIAGFAYCWGTNSYGELGDSTTTDTEPMTPSPVAGGLRFAQVSSGSDHGCGVTTEGDAYCWGRNDEGQLGDGTTEQRLVPTLVAGGLTFAQVSAGSAPFGEEHTCAVTTDNEAYCWGFNGDGQLGDGTSTRRLTPTPVADGLSFAQVSVNRSTTCGVTTGGDAYCWGDNVSGQVGDSTATPRSTPTLVRGGLSFEAVTSGGFHTCGVTTDDDGYCWGSNFTGKLGDGTEDDRWVPTLVVGDLSFAEVSASKEHTCGVTTDHVAYCWGNNSWGALGNGTYGADTNPHPTPEPVEGGLSFARVSADRSGEFSCGITTDDVAYCWSRFTMYGGVPPVPAPLVQ